LLPSLYDMKTTVRYEDNGEDADWTSNIRKVDLVGKRRERKPL